MSARQVRLLAAMNEQVTQSGQAHALLEHVDSVRLEASSQLDEETRGELGQYMTPAPMARLMAGMFDSWPSSVRLLDPGAGVGSLSAAFVEHVCSANNRPEQVRIVAYELDQGLAEKLRATLEHCRELGRRVGTSVEYIVKNEDFVPAAVRAIGTELFGGTDDLFDFVITNPPYRKIASTSPTRSLLRSVGADSTNLYTAFLSLSHRLLKRNGEMVAITPRSFCNGAYFRPFRKELLQAVGLRRVHIFEARDVAFGDDGVLQENIIIHAKKGWTSSTIELRSSPSAAGDLTIKTVKYADVVHPNDNQSFIRFTVDGVAEQVAERMRQLGCSLGDLGLNVSTGRVVDFRSSKHLLPNPTPGSAPLIYPSHFDGGVLQWPREFRKPNAIERVPETEALLVPAAVYVLTKRFSSKEERRRVVAALFDPEAFPSRPIGFENHLNYFHANGSGIDRAIAKGLVVFLNSTLLDEYFRQLSGHTQVNVTDLKNLAYPTTLQLRELGKAFKTRLPTQDEIDQHVSEVLFPMTSKKTKRKADPIRMKRKLKEAIEILRLIGMPDEQLNERTGHVLLALCDLRPEMSWSDVENPLCGITPMMDFFREHYGKEYAPNTREAVRRKSIHQLLEAGHISMNPDDPERPTNSDKTVYQITHKMMALLKTFGRPTWSSELSEYTNTVAPLRAQYERARKMKMVPVLLPSGETVRLAPGGQNDLIKPIIEDFCPRFAPGGTVLYVGDAADKFAVFEPNALEQLGIAVRTHGKMPDLVVHHRSKNWLLLIEAVTSHGPVDAKRHSELRRLFAGSKAGLVFVTAFLNKAAFVKFASQISWETEVWVADSPTHLIHFNGERFLGPYEG